VKHVSLCLYCRHQTNHGPPRNHDLRLGAFRCVIRDSRPSVRDAFLDRLATVVIITGLDRCVLNIRDTAARDTLADSRGDGSLYTRVCLSVAYRCEDLDFVALRCRQ